MIRLAALSGLLAWVGATLVLAETRWLSRPPLAERLAPYRPGRSTGEGRRGPFSVESFRELIAPVALDLGGRLAPLLGINEELAVRLRRVHSRLDVTGFRVRQLGLGVVSLMVTALASLALGVPAVLALVLVASGALLAFLLPEQRLASASASWQHRLFLELPVVAEQLAMLLGAGYSLGSALNRLSERGHGASAADLARVARRVRQGLSEVAALREWASLARVEALDRIVAVLALNSEAADLGRLVSIEAKAIRREAQRSLVETMERRGQQVWVPVTVAALVPGVIFLVIPFVKALSLFAGS